MERIACEKGPGREQKHSSWRSELLDPCLNPEGKNIQDLLSLSLFPSFSL